MFGQKFRQSGQIAAIAILLLGSSGQLSNLTSLSAVHATTVASPSNPAKTNVASDLATISKQPNLPSAPATPDMVDAPNNFNLTNADGAISNFFAMNNVYKTYPTLFSSSSTTGANYVSPSSAGGGQATSLTQASFQNLIYTIYTASSAQHYVIYLPAGTIPAAATGNAATGTISASNITLANLATAAVKPLSITFISDPNDPANGNSTTQDSNANVIQLPGQFNCGCPVAFRNISLNMNLATTNNIVANGYDLAFQSGSFATGNPVYVFGAGDSTGAKTSGTVAQSNIYVASTGDNVWNFYAGGDNTGTQTVTGDTHLTIANTSVSSIAGNGVGTITAGPSNNGNINGSTYMDVQNVGSSVTAGTEVVGAGYGSSNSTVNIGGNVVNKINLPATTSAIFGNIIGGVDIPNGTSQINGTIYNTISGYGQFRGNNVSGKGQYSAIIGGSTGPSNNNVVGNAGNTGNAIVNNVDLSSWSAPTDSANPYLSLNYYGANGGFGTVNGNVYNNVKTSNTVTNSSLTKVTGYNPGSLGLAGYIGGMGNGFSNSNQGPTESWSNLTNDGGNNNFATSYNSVKSYMNLTADQRSSNAAAAQSTSFDGNSSSATNTPGAASTSKIIGNIYNNIQQMLITTGSITAGSFGGYLKGDIISSVGTANSSSSTQSGGSGVVTSVAGNTTSNYAGNTSSNNSGINFFGGMGYYTGFGTSVLSQQFQGYQQGNDYTILNNGIFATVAGSGVQNITDGNSTIYVNGGDYNAIMGSGFDQGLQVGNSNVELNNGHVSTVYSGAVSTGYQVGNSLAYINGGYLTGKLAQGYDLTQPSNITNDASGLPTDGGQIGNSSSDVVAGNLANTTSISGAPAIGTLQGSATVNITGLSALNPTATIIAGGTGNTAVGNGSSSSENLNITLPAGTDWFKGNNLWGDGSNGTNTNIGAINMNVQAPGSSFGTIYATGYATANATPSNLTLQKINRNIMVGDGTTIGSISTSNGSDDYQNSNNRPNYMTNGTQAKITLGDSSGYDITGTAASQGAVNLTGLGAENFNDLAFGNKLTVNLNNTAQIANGAQATAATHGSSYSNFGALTVGDSDILNQNSLSNTVSIGKFIGNTNFQLSQPYTLKTGLFNLSDMDMTTNANSSIQWNPTGTAPALVDPTNPANAATATPNNVFNGNYNGKQMGYPVLTYTGGNAVTGIQQITEPNVTSAYTPSAGSNTNFFTNSTANGKAMFGDYDAAVGVAMMSPEGVATPTAPTTFDFGTYSVGANVNTNNIYTGALTMDDTRFSKWTDANPWTISVSETTPLTNTSGQTLSNYQLNYQNAVGTTQNISSAQSQLSEKAQGGWGYDNISSDNSWKNVNGNGTQGAGFNLKVPPYKATADTTYTGTLTWTYGNVPSN